MMRGLILLLVLAGAAAAEDAVRPRLVLLVSVDQLRPDVLERYAPLYTGGLKRLLADGARFPGLQDHGLTETGPGHSALATGCHPASTGIVANNWIDPKSGRAVYCVEDPKVKRSPVLQLRPALGDWLKAQDPRSKVFSVSGKDRAAITMGGAGPDGVFWYSAGGKGFSTSAYYEPRGRPSWLKSFNADGWLDSLPRRWIHEVGRNARPDDDAHEAIRFSRTSPHPLRGKKGEFFYTALRYTPYVDAFTLRLARTIVDRFDLGGDESVDLLCIGLSATDTVGHLYGPYSQEVRDVVLRLDVRLGEFFAHLEKRKTPFLVALTADHGVLPFENMKRFKLPPLMQRVQTAIRKTLGDGAWVYVRNGQFVVNRALAKERGVAIEKIVEAARAALLAEKSVAAVYDRAALEGDSTGDEILARLRRSYYADRSPDLLAVSKKYAYGSFSRTGTGHGSPYDYDREVPILFWGPGIPAGRRGKIVRTVDIAPTLASVLGVEFPLDIDGRPLVLDEK